MKVTTKRRRSDSAAAAVAASQAAALGPLQPPEHVVLRAGDKPFWNAIMQARARDTWTDVDLTTAATLARTQADIEVLHVTLSEAGYMLEDKPHPLAPIVETLTRRAVALKRVLHVHAEATVGKSEDAAKALELERNARGQDDDELIPRLRAV